MSILPRGAGATAPRRPQSGEMSFLSDAAHAIRRGRRLIALSYIIAATVVVAVLPVAGLALYATYEVSQSHRAETEGRLLEMARTLGSDFESELYVRATVARLLATGQALEALQTNSSTHPRDVARTAQQFANTLSNTTISVWRLGASGATMFVAASAPPDPATALLETVPEVQRAVEWVGRTRRQSLSPLFREPHSDRLMLAVIYPVAQDDVGLGAVVVTMTTDVIQRVVAEQPPPERGVTVVTDSALRVVARLPERFIGETTTADYQQAVTAADSGILRATTLDGVPVVSAFVTPRHAHGFRVVVGAPVESVERSWNRFRNAVTVGTLVAVVLLIGAVLVATRISNSARHLVTDQDAYLSLALENTGLATWESDQITGRAVWSAAHFDLLGYPRNPDGRATAKMWWDALHPDDVRLVQEQWRKARESSDGLMRLSYRIVRRDTGEVRWCESIARFLTKDRLIGVIVDMTESKRQEEQRLLLSREVDHRSKNLLAVVQAMLAMTQAKTVEELRASLSRRIHSLSNTHSLLAENMWKGATMLEVVESELAPYQQSIHINGPSILLRPEAVQPLAMVVHELLTNAIKYGALSNPAGRISVTWRAEEDRLVLNWAERGGPVVSEPTTKGFGSRMLGRVVAQIGGTFSPTWAPSGLTATISLPLARVRQ